MRFTGGVRQYLLRPRVGKEGLAFLDADRLERINHRIVSFEPRLCLNDTVERLEETLVVGDGAVVDEVDRVDKRRCRRRYGFREWIELDPLAVGDRLGNVGLAAALRDRAQ